MPVILPQQLEGFATHLLTQGGVAADEAALVAASLVSANLRGHDSHGVMRIPFYLDAMKEGDVVSGAKFTVLKESPSLLVTDGNWGFGQTQAKRLSESLVEKARTTGLAVGTMIRSSHIGRLGEYCELAASHGFIGMIMVNTHGAARRIAPPGGKVSRLGTNPLCIATPHADGPLVLDFSTSATAEGKVRVKKIAGERCPDGWLLDCEGRPTNDPNKLYDEPAGTILPMGGPQAYKGFGLGLMIEILTGALSGGLCAREVPITPKGNCVFMLVLNPEFFGGAEQFAKEVADLTEFVRGCPRIDGVEEILLPGDPERRVMSKRGDQGIPLDDGNWAELTRLAERLNVAAPTFT